MMHPRLWPLFRRVTKVRIYATIDLSFVHLDEAYGAIINDLPSHPSLRQISMSYGLGELYEAISQLQTDSQYFATLAAEGVTIFVSTGDGGSTPGLNGAGPRIYALNPINGKPDFFNL